MPKNPVPDFGRLHAQGGIVPLESAVPQYPDPMELMKQVPGASATVPALGGLGSAITGANQAQLLQQYGQAMPGMVDAFGTASTQIGQMLKGIIPQDVMDQIQNATAASSLRGGFAGAPIHGNALARNLGLTSLDLIGKGIGALGSLAPVAKSTLTVAPWDVGAQVPGYEDLYNQQASEEAARASYAQSLQAAKIAEQTMKTVGEGSGLDKYNAARQALGLTTASAPVGFTSSLSPRIGSASIERFGGM